MDGVNKYADVMQWKEWWTDDTEFLPHIENLIATIRAKDEELAALRTLVIAQSESMELFASCIDDAEIECLRKIEDAAREYVKSRSVNDMRDTLNVLERLLGEGEYVERD